MNESDESSVATQSAPTRRVIARCPVCGTVLVEGLCAAHGRPGGPEPRAARPAPASGPGPARAPAGTPAAASAPARPAAAPAANRIGPGGADRRLPVPVVAGGIAVVIILAAVGMLWSTTSTLRSKQRSELAEQSQTIQELQGRIEDQNIAAGRLNDRLAKIEEATGNQPDTVALAKTVQGSVFTIEAGPAQGSGFFLGKKGRTQFLITNHHVVADVWAQGGRTVHVRGGGGQAFDATIERVDAVSDLALLKANVDQPALKVAEKQPVVGDNVLVVGSPLGLEGTVSSGMVSAIRVEAGMQVIQFTAAISPGSSGGPVINAQGQVIAVAFAGVPGMGDLYFGIPISEVCTALEFC